MSGTPRTLAERVEAFWQEAREHLEGCRWHCFATRGREIQVGCRDGLHEWGQRCRDLKAEAVAAGDESLANAILAIECISDAVYQELSMWIALKDDDAETAWHCLVVAQGAVRCAMKAHHVGEAVKGMVRHLHGIEVLVFPPQTFVSSAFKIGRYECSICGAEYGQCRHVVGRAYMGEMCSKLPRGIEEIRHVAIVLNEDPMDKRCRVTSRLEDGEDRDTLTWRVVPEDPESGRAPPLPGRSRMTVCMLHADGEPGT